MNRVDELADRELGFRPKDAYGYVKLVELDKIIAEALNIKSRKSKKVQEIYHYLVSEFGSEMEILLSTNPEKVGELADPAIGEALNRVKNGKLLVEPGFDGQYGLVKIFSSEEHKQNKQGRLF
jgi:PHP family Zn ribbon phosphoesterase